MKYLPLIFLLITGLANADYPCGVLPNVPGVLNPDVTQETIYQTICVSGWTKTVRPNVRITNKIKRALLAKVSDENPKHYELDHNISLQLGGALDDAGNLWLQPYAGKCGARVKDVIEGKLKRLICAGSITLGEAQQEITRDWVASYNKHISPDNPLVCE